MTRPASARKIKRRHVAPKPPQRKPMSDRAIYLGSVIIGLFVVLLGSIMSEVRYASLIAVGYIAVLCYLILANTYQIYRGNQHLSDWQRALAKIPLRFVGYGSRGGKALEAAHHHPETLKAFFVMLVISVLVLAALAHVSWRWLM